MNKTIIMSHGGGGLETGMNWEDSAKVLCEEKGYRVLCLDLRGHGSSEWSQGSQYNIFEFVVDFRNLLEHPSVDLPEKVTLIGHSFGGCISMLVASLFADRVERIITVEGIVFSGLADLEALALGEEDKLDRDRSGDLLTWISAMRGFEGRPTRTYNTREEARLRFRASRERMDQQHERGKLIKRLSVETQTKITKNGLKRFFDEKEQKTKWAWKHDPFVRLK